ncbi:MAG: hypothetical protein JWP91_3393 [Fibrobacteres bacterium]|nr:hypothetical protein [Fibrobacterota bacterium]
MLDLTPIANAIRTVQPQPQALPSVTEDMKPVPGTEIQAPVPPPAKGSEPGLGEHFDVYDTQVPPNPPATKETKAKEAIPDNAPTPEVQQEISRARESEAKKEKAKAKPELLGRGTGLPQPTTEPLHLEMPFLKPLGKQPLGRSIDSTI